MAGIINDVLTGSSLSVTNPVTVSNGGTGASTLTGVLTGNGTSAISANSVTEHGVLIGGASNAVASTAVGVAGQVLTSNGPGMDPTFEDNPQGDVVGPASSTLNAVARFADTTGNAIQNSGVTIDNSDVVSGVTQLNVDNLRLDGNTLSSTDTNGNIVLSPDGTGEVVVQTLNAGSSNDLILTLGDAAGANDLIVQNTTPDTLMNINSLGYVTKPLQPSFAVYVDNTISNATGAGVVYTIIYDTEIYDRGGDFNLGTGTFTAPVDGVYHFNANIGLSGLGDANTQCSGRILTSNGLFQIISLDPGDVRDSNNVMSAGNGVTIELDATDTASVSIFVAGGSQTVSIQGTESSPTFRNHFSGALLC